MKLLSTLLLIIAVAGSTLHAQDVKPDPRAEKLVNSFMLALMEEDMDASAKQCLNYVHKSLKNKAGDDLTKDLRTYSFKKAHDNAKFYETPVKITRVRTEKTTAIGFGDTGEKGTEYSYFIAKKKGEAGMPAPIKIFFPADGSDPKISYMGSL